MAEQFAFDLPARAALGREDFFVTPANARALEVVEGWRGWPGGKLALIGPAGSGKTHLAHVWAAEAAAVILPAAMLAGADVDALARRGAVVVEDICTMPRTPQAERALLHLHNHLLAAGGRLLLTAATPPARWPITLPDLSSRMQATPTARLDAPDDALLSAVLVKLFADRQIVVAPNVIAYLVLRMERTLAGAQALVAVLDQSALAQGRAVTRALAMTLFEADKDT